MNRKLYDENQQFKDRTCDQRQQIENFNIMFQENKKESERAINVLRKELDELTKRENLEKRRMQSTFETKHQEAMQIISSLRKNLDEMQIREANLLEEIQQERNKSEISEKKIKLNEKDLTLLRETSELERREWNASHKQAIQEIEVTSLFFF